MWRKLFLVLLFVMHSNLSASQVRYIVGEGEFLTTEEDSSKFVKAQLISSATKDILNKYFKNIDVDPIEFWQGFEMKLNKKLEGRLELLDQKIAAYKEKGDLDSIKKIELEKRNLKLNYTARFLKKAQVFTSYSIVKKTSSTANPLLKFMTLKAKVNKSQLKRLYFKMTKDEFKRTYKKVYIHSKIEFAPELKLNEEISEQVYLISELLGEKWEKWLEKYFGDEIEDIEVIDSEELQQMQKFIQTPPGIQLSELDSTFGSDPYEDSVFISAEFIINEIEFSAEESEGYFKASGGHLVYDLNGRKIIEHSDYANIERTIYSSELKNLSSSLATRLYNAPLPKWRKLKTTLAKVPKVNNRVNLSFKDSEGVENFFTLSDFLTIRGAQMNFQVGDISFAGDKILADIDFMGEPQEVYTKMKELEAKKISDNLKCRVNVIADQVELELEKIEEPQPEKE